MPKVLLASGSFLRRFIMDQTKVAYETVAADIDESVFDDLPVEERVVRLAEKKCQTVSARHSDYTVIAADTLTVKDGQVYSKRTHKDDPLAAALALSGQTITVYTGCAVFVPGKPIATHLSIATITYQIFSEATLRRLAQDDNPNIRSGALGIFYDAPGFTLIERLEGSYTGAFGLPMEFVNHYL
jgi:MAF protein